MIMCQSTDDSSKNVGNRAKWITLVAGRTGKERSNQEE